MSEVCLGVLSDVWSVLGTLSDVWSVFRGVVRCVECV